VLWLEFDHPPDNPRDMFFGRILAYAPDPLLKSTPDAFYADTAWSTNEIKLLLADLTLGPDTPLSCLAVEILPGGSPTIDPLGAGLGQERILRTSFAEASIEVRNGASST